MTDKNMTDKNMTETTDARVRTDMSGPLRFGALSCVALAGIFGLWAGFTTISGAVIAPGVVVVDGDPREVQHLDGGIVAQIAVSDGDVVTAGDMLVGLDATLLQTTHDVSTRRLAVALTRTARLEAELAGTPDIDFSGATFGQVDMAPQIAMQRDIFATRAALRTGQDAALRDTLSRTDNQITGAQAEQAALDRQSALLKNELTRIGGLVARNLIRVDQQTALMQQDAQLAGEAARIATRIIELTDSRHTATLVAQQETRNFRDTATTELAVARAEAEELTLEIVTRTAQLDRVVLRAPVSGVVHELQVRSPGAVITPGATVMQIVPQGYLPLVEINVDPRGIDQVHVGQGAEIMLASFDPNVAPKLHGTVMRVSADAVRDPQTGLMYYKVLVALTQAEIARMGDVAILPGMPVEAYLKTQERTVLAYLTQPLTQALGRAFREG